MNAIDKYINKLISWLILIIPAKLLYDITGASVYGFFLMWGIFIFIHEMIFNMVFNNIVIISVLVVMAGIELMAFYGGVFGFDISQILH